jgi:uncharacterized membrane protein
MSPAVPGWFAAVGRAFFASAIVFFGAEHLFAGRFVTRILPAWPDWLPAAGAWPYVAGVALMGAGVALFIPTFARRAGLALGAVVLASALLLAVPPAIESGSLGLAWTNTGKALVLGAGALVVAASVAPAEAGPQRAALLAVGRLALSGFLILCGIQHFLWARFVVALVPAWIPAPLFWTYFAGVALIAGGVGLWVRPTARAAAMLTALMILLWVFLLHVPRALAIRDFNEATAVAEALAVTGIALLLAAVPAGTAEPSDAAAAGFRAAPERAAATDRDD